MGKQKKVENSWFPCFFLWENDLHMVRFPGIFWVCLQKTMSGGLHGRPVRLPWYPGVLGSLGFENLEFFGQMAME